MLRLTQLNVIPPGGYEYTQPETGMFFDGNLTFKPQCHAIRAHRRANNLPRTAIEEVAEDVVLATCTRLPALCKESTTRASQAIVTGVKSTRRNCGTCGGRKLKK